MNCPDCNGESRVVKTVVGVDLRQRYRQCNGCGVRWVSEERNLKIRWGTVTGNPPATMGNHGQPPPTAGNQPPTVGNGGGVGGGLPSGSDLDPLPDPSSRSGSYSDRDPDPGARLSLVPPEPDPKTPRKAQQDAFSSEFLTFWSIYPRKVAKPLAWRSWKRQRPKLDDILASLAWQMESAQWQDPEKIPHPSSYLNGRRWEDERLPVRVTANGANAPPNPRVGYARASEMQHKGGGTDHEF